MQALQLKARRARIAIERCQREVLNTVEKSNLAAGLQVEENSAVGRIS